MLKALLFDLDGTLLPMDEKKFTDLYFSLICKKLQPYGYEPEKLIKTVATGTRLMVKNDGTKTNAQAFWDNFESVYGTEAKKHEALFDEFYISDFKKTKIACGENLEAAKIVEHAKAAGFKVILASNPLFPKNGFLTRAAFTGLCEKHFDYMSDYENSHYAKPNHEYFLEILKNNGLNADEVFLFGNSETEDIAPATAARIKSFTVKGDCLCFDDYIRALSEIQPTAI